MLTLIAGYLKSGGFQWEVRNSANDLIASGPGFNQQDAQTNACNWAKSQGFKECNPRAWSCDE
jgi:hypothetical protein